MGLAIALTRALGVTLLGDGSTEAFLGRVQRQLIEPRGGEDAYGALAREVRARVK